MIRLAIFCDTTIKMYQSPFNGVFSPIDSGPDISTITNKCKCLSLGPQYAYKLAIIYDDFNLNVF